MGLLLLNSSVAKAGADTGAGADVSTALAVALLTADSGMGSDNVGDMVWPEKFDSAVGSETSTVGIDAADQGAGTDGAVLVDIISIDSGAGAETLIQRWITLSDLASGSEAISFSRTVSDSGTGEEYRSEAIGAAVRAIG